MRAYGRTTEMTTRLTPQTRKKLIEVGEALDIDQQLAVGDGGEVFVNPLDERAEHAERECEGTSGRERSQRWAGQSAGPRQEAGPCEAPWIGGGSLGEHYRLSQEAVMQRYTAKFFAAGAGLWVIAPSSPLGADGPQFHLAVALPYAEAKKPSAWAFSKLGSFPKLVGPRHTNFPDHTICAYGPNDGVWVPGDGIRPLLNLYSTWLFRHLYLAEMKVWPGRQWGASALYRRSEFHPDEWCGCGKSSRYRDCCMAADFLVPDDLARTLHFEALGSHYGARKPPKAVMNFARSNWSKIPQIS